MEPRLQRWGCPADAVFARRPSVLRFGVDVGLRKEEGDRANEIRWTSLFDRRLAGVRAQRSFVLLKFRSPFVQFNGASVWAIPKKVFERAHSRKERTVLLLVLPATEPYSFPFV